MSLYGVTVRWSLHATPNGVADQLRAHVEQAAGAGADDLADLHQTLWTLREGGSFGVTYIFRSMGARVDAVRRIRAQGSPVATILGRSADAIEEFDILAIAPGRAGPQSASER